MQSLRAKGERCPGAHLLNDNRHAFTFNRVPLVRLPLGARLWVSSDFALTSRDLGPHVGRALQEMLAGAQV